MKTLFPRLKKAFPFLGSRSVTEEDIFEFAAARNIEIIFTPNISNACYVVYEGFDFIFVNSKLRGRRLLHRLCHEIGHFIFHVPSQSRFGVEFFDLHSKKNHEEEAESVAALLMLPLHEIEEAVFSGIFKYDIEMQNLIAVRKSFAKKFGK